MDSQHQFTLRAQPVGARLVIVEVRGEIDAATHVQLQELMAESCQRGICYLLLDLSAVPFMGSAGLRALHVIDEMLRQQAASSEREAALGGDSFKSPCLKLLNPHPAVARTLTISGFEMIFDIFSDRQAAIASFG